MAPQIMMHDEFEQPLEKPLQSQLIEEDYDHTSVTEITDGTASDFLSQRKICFNAQVFMCEIPSRADLSEEELAMSFYSPDEIAFMNEEQNETADRMEAGKKAKKSTPYRGLEAWTQSGQHQMNQRIFACVDSVLDEQDNQWQKGKTSSRKIAKASKSLTKTSLKIALELAKQDEKDARKIYEEELNAAAAAADQAQEQQEPQPRIPLSDMIRNSTIMKSKKIKKKISSSSNKSLDGSQHSMDLGVSMHSHDSCDSGFWSLTSNSLLFDNNSKPKKKKRTSKRKSAAREGKLPQDTPAKTAAPARRTSISKKEDPPGFTITSTTAFKMVMTA